MKKTYGVEKKLAGKSLLTALALDYTYDAKSGRFIRNSTKGGRPAGSLAGRISKRGYRELSVANFRYREHRLVWLWLYGELPSAADGSILQIDHIDGDRTNNRQSNLRLATQQSNSKNMMLRPNNTSGVCGVTKSGKYVDGTQKWTAQIKVNYKSIFLGNFRSIEEATAVRKAAESKYKFDKNHGEYREKNHTSYKTKEHT